ncbi:MAG: hypothetical protein KF774_21605 [Planctomyces sp.]|nr:hypothetical protein [Planctomyces sp.]
MLATLVMVGGLSGLRSPIATTSADDLWKASPARRHTGAVNRRIDAVPVAKLDDLQNPATRQLQACDGYCFTAGTQVVVAQRVSTEDHGAVSWRLTPIEEVSAGDWVLAADEWDGRLGVRRVRETSRRISDHVRRVIVRDEAGGMQALETTDEHPFWVVGRRMFVEAGELAPGDQLSGPGGELQVVERTEREPCPQGVAVFNFEVEGYHTYFVLARGSRGPPVWVHNTCPTQLPDGSFSIINWSDYPQLGVPQPQGPFRLLQGEEYAAALKAKKSTNKALHKANPAKYDGLHIHEIHPVKFGGSPTDINNKIPLPPHVHHQHTSWWNRMQRALN